MKHSVVRSALAVAAIVWCGAPVLAAETTYRLDTAHVNLVWHANHMGFSTPSGKFTDVQGVVVLDDVKPENSTVTVTIKPASIVTGIEKFDEHLKSKDFFNVQEFPGAKFVSTEVVPSTPTTAKVRGTLTLLGISKPVTLDVTLNKVGPNPVTKEKTAGFSATTIIKRSDFNMIYALPAVSDEVKLTIEAEAIAK